jgi:hypothetical protein
MWLDTIRELLDAGGGVEVGREPWMPKNAQEVEHSFHGQAERWARRKGLTWKRFRQELAEWLYLLQSTFKGYALNEEGYLFFAVEYEGKTFSAPIPLALQPKVVALLPDMPSDELLECPPESTHRQTV